MTLPLMEVTTSPIPAPDLITVSVPGIQGNKGLQGDTTPIIGPTSVSGTITPDTSWYTTLRCLDLIGNLTIGTMPIPTGAVGTISLSFKQTGSFTVTWPSEIKWSGGAPAPIMPTAFNSELLVHLLWTGRGWRGAVAGTYF
jgi:hypothetical protein